MEGKIRYAFSATVWQHAATGGWYFVSLPTAMSAEIRQHLKWQEEGWGRIKAEAKIGKSQWQTAIWFDTKHQTYLLPLKAEIRKKESVKNDQPVRVQVYI
ncbi:MAG: DUF1905 domain-containing protein [Sphingobacteriales bacterium]|jgi:hypothetical protein|nr:DUF1905 domain-containing protein [Sphingobacteriales bacterium]